MSKDKGLGPSMDFGVPMDEYDLACAVAAVKARGLKGTMWTFYRDADGRPVASSSPEDPDIASCCAVGALAICKGVTPFAAGDLYPYAPPGNDEGDYPVTTTVVPFGVDLGRAYAHIMDLRTDDDA